MGLFDFLIRDPKKLSFKSFIERVRRLEGDEVADEVQEKTIDGLLRLQPNLTLSEIETMKWGDVSFKIKRLEKQLMDELLAMDKVIALATSQSGGLSSFINDPGWGYSLENLDENR